ncbi:hypothetical protein [Roseateles terrae]|uniref:Uncharacterized protein n=1 Tax=Roseateles terrae TaxID=431060 RepID=A0ABR6GLY0_9BURK|nr:hypothetical protein [Roseateles terrae]MBB3193116.1 hypothetical protein [Roseateles terrae]
MKVSRSAAGAGDLSTVVQETTEACPGFEVHRSPWALHEQVVEETLFVLDVDAAFAVAGDIRRQFYGAKPQLASNLIGVSRPAFKEQLIEITFRVDLSIQ